jgi:hypothetical protein
MSKQLQLKRVRCPDRIFLLAAVARSTWIDSVAFCHVRIGNSAITPWVVASRRVAQKSEQRSEKLEQRKTLGATKMSSPKSALAAAAILSLTMIGSAAALPADNLASTAKASAGIQQVRWVCGPRGCFWRRNVFIGPRFAGRGAGWGWRRPLYGFAGGRWGWRGRGWGWRHGWRRW